MPGFTATLSVHDQIFGTPAQCKSTKEAQNTAAGVAFEHFNEPVLSQVRHMIDSNDNIYKDTLHMYMNELQQFVQKKNLGLSVYTNEAEGPSHAHWFKSSVCVRGKSYVTEEIFWTLKEAEQAAAKVACQELSVDVTQENGGLYKNLLQQFAQKRGLLCPLYETVQSGVPHSIYFITIHVFQS
ncbi:Double-stranded RNA-binding protein 4 [Striga hermonthica]|uniref:Double-stranded RNA-binding protein 4 n=1 Tax=Striga hermonthica TaxID=68872 RepID=A0A9N7N822_STRHE|nr:Double-stranded RNA-binding protein 4 [Striga hermonthica]